MERSLEALSDSNINNFSASGFPLWIARVVCHALVRYEKGLSGPQPIVILSRQRAWSKARSSSLYQNSRVSFQVKETLCSIKGVDDTYPPVDPMPKHIGYCDLAVISL